MLEHPEITLRAAAVGLFLIGLYGGLGAALAQRGQVALRGDEVLTLGACLTVIGGSLLGLAARGAPALDLTLASALLVLLPLAVVLLLLRPRPRTIEWRSLARRAVPWVALILAATALVATIGLNATFRNDADRRAQAVKELVWANSIEATAGDLELPAENSKYLGYLSSRAMVTQLAGTDPWAPSLVWVMIGATGLVAGLLALVRNLGLPLWTAAVAIVAMPLLGGDAYRLPAVGDPRAVGAMLLIGGLAFVARALGKQSRSAWWLGGLGGAICGASALVHVQYVVITASVLLPALVLAVILLGPREVRTPSVAFAGVIAISVICVGFAQGSSLVGSSTLAETAAERTEGKTVTDKELLTSGRSVWPPRSITVNGVELLYRSPSLYVLHPSALVDTVWGERTSFFLAAAGVIAAVMLRRRASPFLLSLLAGTALVPLVVLFNPVVYPFFDRHFASYRAEYIGFELPFIGLAAVAAALVVHRARAAPLALATAVAAVPVVRGTIDWHRVVHREHQNVEQNPALRTFRDLQRWALFSDLIVASSPAMSHAVSLQTESPFVDARFLTPNPLAAGARTSAVLRSLSLLNAGGRTVVVVDETTPVDAAIRRLIAAGRVPSAIGNDGDSGIYWLRVVLPE